MSKLAIFIFIGVCVMAVHMVSAYDDDSEEAEAILAEALDSLAPQIKAELEGIAPKVNWKKVWDKSKPVLIEAGKIAAGAAVSGIVGK